METAVNKGDLVGRPLENFKYWPDQLFGAYQIGDV
jgi:hypothetical protein